jgi:hypothetical protein
MKKADSLILVAGPHNRVQCPVRFSKALPADCSALSINGKVLPVQKDEQQCVFLLDYLDSGSAAEIEYVNIENQPYINMENDGVKVNVFQGDKLFFSYYYSGAPARPFLWPLLTPGGIPVTRGWPIRDAAPGESTDHIHHRSLWIAYGDVNKTDNWSEQPGHGCTVHRKRLELIDGPVFGRIKTLSDWVDKDGNAMLSQHLTLTAWKECSQFRLLDAEIILEPLSDDVIFGDTKEGGLLSVRVASEMEASRGGLFVNSFGGVNEKEVWGQPAHWCDYSGISQGETAGIAVMDHPDSFRHPTWWHARDYGLMTANPFALSEYTGGKLDGSYRLASGEKMRFKYRVMIHDGSAESADVRTRYLDFAAPPIIKER